MDLLSILIYYERQVRFSPLIRHKYIMRDFFREKRVLAKINQGNEDTFLKMYDFYAPKLFRHIYYRISNKETSQDLTQEIFYKTWRFLKESENKIDNLNAFLYRIANNLITDYYRKAERKNISLEENLERKLPAETSYTAETEKNLEISKIKQSLTQLNPEQQKLIIWRYFDNLSIKQISQISGKSKNAIYVSIHRSLKELQKIISQKYENL